MYVQCLVENEISSETEALVGKTGSSIDQHLAAAIGLDYRIGHPDLFHVIDGLGRPFFGHRASQPKKTESSESSASSSSSSSVCSDGGQRAGQAEQADCSGQSSAREPAPPVPVLRTWSRLVRTQKRMLGRGQGRVVFNQARPELSVCTKNRLKALLHLLVLFFGPIQLCRWQHICLCCEAFRRHCNGRRCSIQTPAGTRYIVYCGSYLTQAMAHFQVA